MSGSSVGRERLPGQRPQHHQLPQRARLDLRALRVRGGGAGQDGRLRGRVRPRHRWRGQHGDQVGHQLLPRWGQPSTTSRRACRSRAPNTWDRHNQERVLRGARGATPPSAARSQGPPVLLRLRALRQTPSTWRTVGACSTEVPEDALLRRQGGLEHHPEPPPRGDLHGRLDRPGRRRATTTTSTLGTQLGAVGTATQARGGENYIGKYTGIFTENFLVSGQYGDNDFDRTNASPQRRPARTRSTTARPAARPRSAAGGGRRRGSPGRVARPTASTPTGTSATTACAAASTARRTSPTRPGSTPAAPLVLLPQRHPLHRDRLAGLREPDDEIYAYRVRTTGGSFDTSRTRSTSRTAGRSRRG